MEKKWRIKLVLFLTFLATVGIVAIIPYEITTLMNEDYYKNNPEAPSISLVITINSVIRVVYVFLLVLIGVRLQRRTGLNTSKLESFVYEKKFPSFSKKWLIIGISITFILSLITILLDLFMFSPVIEIPDDQTTVTIWWQGLLAMFYGGITEELMVRLFGMTLIVWVLARITKKAKAEIPDSFFYIAIFLTAILFGLGHLPAAIQIFGEISAIIVTRTLVLNGLLGVWFGYLYWRKGLEYAMIAHMSADFFVHVLFMQMFY